jgi:uncharacterized membrane protein
LEEKQPENNQDRQLESVYNAELDKETDSCDDSDITPFEEKVERRVERRVERVLTTRFEQQLFFQGPLPPPEILKAYDLVEPGFALRIVGLAERQADHRMFLEKRVIIGDHNKSWVGLFLGFILSCGVSFGSYDLIKKGHDIAGAAIGSTGIASLIGIFVYGTNQRKQERVEKSKLLDSSDSEDDEE